MPVHKVKGGYKWGKTGKTYPTKKQAERQARAIYANGYKGVNENDNNNGNIKISKNMNRKKTIRLTESELKRVITESVKNILKENSEEYDFQGDVIGQIRNDLFAVLDKYDNCLLDDGIMAGWAYEYISYVHKILRQILPYNQWIKENKN